MTLSRTLRERAWPETALIVPVREAEPAVRSWLGHVPDFDGAPLHVTVLYPFVPARRAGRATERAVAELAGGAAPFRFRLAALGTFPGVHFLAPDPPDPFVALVEAAWHRWPGCPPYGGAYDAIVPHVTVAHGDRSPADPAHLAARLPISAHATELQLLDRHRGRWRLRRRFPLGDRTRRDRTIP